jgi:hypothetical protein
MSLLVRYFGILLVLASIAQGADPVAKQFLRFIYGAKGIELSNICHPSVDAWMLRGAMNTNALTVLKTLKVEERTTGITSGVLGRDIYFIETRDGKVEPAFNLDGIYLIHRRLVLHFLYAALSQDTEMLGRVTTDPDRVTIDGPTAAPGDMGQYGSILEMLPVIRAGKPEADAKTRSVVYRVPIGGKGLSITLVKKGSTWKVDTSKPMRVPLGFFFQ